MTGAIVFPLPREARPRRHGLRSGHQRSIPSSSAATLPGE